MEDRRKAAQPAEKRSNARDAFGLKIRGARPGGGTETTWHDAKVENMSLAGMQLVTRQAYSRGQRIQIHIPTSPLGPAKTLYAEVRWRREADTTGLHVLGCQFVG